MASLNIEASESEQMYLTSVARMVEADCGGPVPIASLAEALAVQPVSANQMARKLEEAGLLVYRPDKGVELTAEGGRIAARILRYRRLWEVFLVRCLGLSIEEARAAACGLEHDTTEEIAGRLDAYLGCPAVNPEGKPIPRAEAGVPAPEPVELVKIKPGRRAKVVRCRLQGAARSYLEEQGLFPGAAVAVAAAAEDSLLVQAGEKFISLSSRLAQAVYVEPDSEEQPRRHKETKEHKG